MQPLQVNDAARFILNNATDVKTHGSKPLAQRRSLGVLLGGALLAATALLSVPEAQAQSWRDMIQQDQSSSNRYNTNETLRRSNVRIAKVVQVDYNVSVENGNRVNAGAVIGAGIAGSLIDNSIRDSGTRNAARVLSAGLGGLIGQKTQQAVTRNKGVRLTFLEGNNLTSIVQRADKNMPQFQAGDLVLLEGNGSRLRVAPVSPEMKRELLQVMNQEPSRPSRSNSQYGY